MANFFHSFPRKDRSNKMGLAILESILEMGFLLTPEVTRWNEDNTNAQAVNAYSTRMCFTLLEEIELVKHSELFGNFAIELKPESLIALGGLPTIYLPNKPESDEGVSALGSAYLNHLANLDSLVRSLAKLEQSIEQQKTSSQNLRIGEEKEINCDVESASALIESLKIEIGGSSFLSIAQAQMSFSELVYQTGDNTRLSVGELGYYQQREWKISGRVTSDGNKLTRHPTEQEQLKLKEINPAFFNKDLKFSGISKSRAERSLLYPTIERKDVISYIERILVPESAIENAQKLLKKLNLKINIGVTPHENN
jgi:hypothetical protein